MKGLWKGVDLLGLFSHHAVGIESLMLVKKTAFLVPHSEGKAARWLTCLLGTGAVRSLHFERNLWEVLAAGSFLLCELFSLILRVSLSYANSLLRSCVLYSCSTQL